MDPEEKMSSKQSSMVERRHSADEILTANCAAYTFTVPARVPDEDKPPVALYEDVP